MVGMETFLKRIKSGGKDSLKSRGLKLKIALTSNNKVSNAFIDYWETHDVHVIVFFALIFISLLEPIKSSVKIYILQSIEGNGIKWENLKSTSNEWLRWMFLKIPKIGMAL